MILTDPAGRDDRVLVSHLFVRPGGRVVAEHLHPTITERFHVLAGEVGFLIDGRERRLGPGETAEVAPGVRHDWWQIGEAEAQVVVEVEPGDRFLEIVATTFGLARDGETTEEGLPHPLQGAVSLRAYREVIVFTKPPIAAQRLMFPRWPSSDAPWGAALPTRSTRTPTRPLSSIQRHSRCSTPTAA